MNKMELIEAVAENGMFIKKDAAVAVNAVLEEIGKALKAGETVTLVGFGTFKVTRRKARTGRNPRTGKAIKITAKNVPVFKAGATLKSMVK